MPRLYRYTPHWRGYNRAVNPATSTRLIEINRDFYTRFGESFSATRHRIQPGVRHVLQMLHGDESILDLGCGNGEFARQLAKRGHRGPYLGVDFSIPLLRDAESQPEGFQARFIEADLTQLSVGSDHLSVVSQQLLNTEPSPLHTDVWSLITAFAVLHHLPSKKLRLDILRTVHDLLADAGRFILSNWQFLNSEKLKSRIQPWEAAGLKASDVDSGDYLLDWRNGGEGLRYVHHFSEQELSSLADEAGFIVNETFYSDGETGNLGLYQIWELKH